MTRIRFRPEGGGDGNFRAENDTGARDYLAQFGQKHFDDALAEANSVALPIRGNASCAPVISKYLRGAAAGAFGGGGYCGGSRGVSAATVGGGRVGAEAQERTHDRDSFGEDASL